MVSQINNQSGMGYSTMNPQVKNTINIDWAFKLTNFINGKHLSKKAKWVTKKSKFDVVLIFIKLEIYDSLKQKNSWRDVKIIKYFKRSAP